MGGRRAGAVVVGVAADGSTPSRQLARLPVEPSSPSFYWPAEHVVIINEPVTRSIFAFSCVRGGMGMSWPIGAVGAARFE